MAEEPEARLDTDPGAGGRPLDAVRLVVGGRHATLLQALTAWLEDAGASVVGASRDPAEVCRSTVMHQPDVCIVEDRLCDQTVVRLVTQIRHEAPGVKLVILETTVNRSVHQAFARGLVEAVVHPTCGLDILRDTVFHVMDGKRVSTPRRPTSWAIRLPRTAKAGLSNREEEVLGLLVRGATNGQIAQELDISVNTVRTHVQNLLQKLGVDRRSKAVSAVATWMGPAAGGRR